MNEGMGARGCLAVRAGLPSERSEVQTSTRTEIWIEISAPCASSGDYIWRVVLYPL